MSNPTTFYTVGGLDLSNIFQPYSGPPSAITTGYKVNTTDLNQIFAPYIPGNPQASPTGYTVPIYGDLNTIFASMPFYTATGDYTKTSDGTYNTIITFKSGIGTILFNTNVGTVSCIVVGGGGGADHGAKAASQTSGGSGGNGGGGGQVIQQNLTYSIATSYNISIGAGGTGGLWVVNSLPPPSYITVASTDGNSSSLDIIVALGGTKNSGGIGGIGGTGASDPKNGVNGSQGTNGYGSSGGGGGGGIGRPSPQSKGGTSTNGAGSGGGGGGGTGDTGGGAGDNTGGGGGGGGGAGSAQPQHSSNGGNGGSGIIILKFNT